jgi:hypothetical protein
MRKALPGFFLCACAPLPAGRNLFSAKWDHLWWKVPARLYWESENISQAKGNECSQYKSRSAIFSSSLPIFPSVFSQVRASHFL